MTDEYGIFDLYFGGGTGLNFTDMTDIIMGYLGAGE